MDAKIMTLCRCRVVIAVLFVLAVIILAVAVGRVPWEVTGVLARFQWAQV